mgnify:CR=1 FL=1
MTRTQCTETGKQLLQELKTTLAQVDPAYAEEQLLGYENVRIFDFQNAPFITDLNNYVLFYLI